MTPVVADDVIEPPLAFSGQRLDWRDLPRHVRARIAALAGAQVTAEISATSGFSPGFAAVLELADGRGVFVKAVSAEQNPASPDLARAEIRVASGLPPSVPAPRLLWSDDDGDWVLLGFEVVHGRSPEIPWQADDLEAVLAALDVLGGTEPLAGHALLPAHDQLGEAFTGWRSLAAMDREPQDALVEQAGSLGTWARSHIDELVEWEADALRAMAGTALVHGDLRADNILIDPDHFRVAFIDWPHACVGAPWLDLAFMLPSVAMQGGGDPHAIFQAHPLAEGVSPTDLRAVLAAQAGYFAWHGAQPAPLGIPNLRRFQLAQAVAATRWLRDVA